MSLKQVSAQRRGNAAKLFKFGVVLWSVVGIVALSAAWPYAFSAVLLATFLHLAALDGAD